MCFKDEEDGVKCSLMRTDHANELSYKMNQSEVALNQAEAINFAIMYIESSDEASNKF